MPIVINEIEVSVEVAGAGNNGANAAPSVDKEEIIKECVEKIMEILNQKNER